MGTPPVDGTTSFVKFPNHVPRRSAADMFLDRPTTFKPARVSIWMVKKIQHIDLGYLLSSARYMFVYDRKQEDAPINIGTVSQYLKDKKITPSTLKFGFLGLGIMGRGIVKNLLNSGHNVIVWNRTPEKVRRTIFVSNT